VRTSGEGLDEKRQIRHTADKMSMYYLHRDGETTGPFGQGRIADMIRDGEISDQDQVCAHGTEEWIPAGFVVPGPPAAPGKLPPAGIRKTRPMAGMSWMLFLFAIVSMLLLPWLIGVTIAILMIVVAVCVDRPRYLCGGCGNRIERTSQICPACRRDC
jgi:hypothetical protein